MECHFAQCRVPNVQHIADFRTSSSKLLHGAHGQDSRESHQERCVLDLNGALCSRVATMESGSKVSPSSATRATVRSGQCRSNRPDYCSVRAVRTAWPDRIRSIPDPAFRTSDEHQGLWLTMPGYFREGIEPRVCGTGAASRRSPLAGLETRVGLVDDVHPALSPHHPAVPVTLLQGLERVRDFHDTCPAPRRRGN